MGRFRQGSLARRVAISAFALYALLLQGFLAASTPAAAFAFEGGISCDPIAARRNFLACHWIRSFVAARRKPLVQRDRSRK
jgi:hypothetical protein